MTSFANIVFSTSQLVGREGSATRNRSSSFSFAIPFAYIPCSRFSTDLSMAWILLKPAV